MWQDKIKALVEQQKEKGNKRNIENLIVFLIILIVTIIAINTIWKDDKKENVNEPDNTKILAIQENSKDDISSEQQELEQRLESILTKIEGVGKVSVLITYSETSEFVAMYNENFKESSTEEADTGGGTRKISEVDNSKEIIYKEENGQKVPVTQKLILPKIEGAVVTAEGARNAEIKANIIQAVEAATGLATHKIQVFTMQL